jgi:hypothetical protein
VLFEGAQQRLAVVRLRAAPEGGSQGLGNKRHGGGAAQMLDSTAVARLEMQVSEPLRWLAAGWPGFIVLRFSRWSEAEQ